MNRTMGTGSMKASSRIRVLVIKMKRLIRAVSISRKYFMENPSFLSCLFYDNKKETRSQMVSVLVCDCCFFWLVIFKKFFDMVTGCLVSVFHMCEIAKGWFFCSAYICRKRTSCMETASLWWIDWGRYVSF